MLSVAIIPKERQKGMLTILVDHEPWKEVHTSIFGKNPVLSSCQDANQLNAQFKQLETAGAKRYAIRLLSLRSYPSTQLFQALRRRFVTEESAQDAVAWCLSQGFLSDDEWIQSFVRVQQARRVGPKRIVQKLCQKGISFERAESAVQSCTQKESIAHLLKTRHVKANFNDHKDKQKVIASLLRKGFEFDAILEVINESLRTR